MLWAGTSVGSNVEETDGSVSRKDLVNHIRIPRKQARESRFWLALIEAASLPHDPDLLQLQTKADELVRILSKIALRAGGMTNGG